MFCNSMFDIMLLGHGDTNDMPNCASSCYTVGTTAEQLNLAEVKFG